MRRRRPSRLLLLALGVSAALFGYHWLHRAPAAPPAVVLGPRQVAWQVVSEGRVPPSLVTAPESTFDTVAATLRVIAVTGTAATAPEGPATTVDSVNRALLAAVGTRLPPDGAEVATTLTATSTGGVCITAAVGDGPAVFASAATVAALAPLSRTQVPDLSAVLDTLRIGTAADTGTCGADPLPAAATAGVTSLAAGTP